MTWNNAQKYFYGMIYGISFTVRITILSLSFTEENIIRGCRDMRVSK